MGPRHADGDPDPRPAAADWAGPGAPQLTLLAAAARDGNPDAAEELWRAARPRMLRIALALGVPPDDAPDLVQDALLAAHHALAGFDPVRGRFECWVAAIVVRRAHNRRRGLARFAAALARLGRGDSDRGRGAAALEARLTVSRLFDALTPQQREVISLYEIGGLAADEAGALLGLTAAGVRSIARDARERLARAAGREER